MSKLYIGSAYYPEHFPWDQVDRDLDLMAEAGFNLIRIAEFAWSRLEPEEGRYELDWVDEIIQKAAKRGIVTVLGTPTSAVVAWLAAKYPEVLRVQTNGNRQYFGQHRKNACYSSDVFREHSRRITAAMAERFGADPNVIGWQIDNEFSCNHVLGCFCEGCESKFRAWLKAKYGTVENLNEKLRLSFWSMEANDWSDIHAPHEWPSTYHPQLMLEWRRFHNDYVVDYQRLMADTIRAVTDQPITHNMMGTKLWTDYYKLAEDLDIAGWDNYAIAPVDSGIQHDLMYSTKMKRFWVLEQQNWLGPENIRLTTYQAIAKGADMICYFKWRTGLAGYEAEIRGIVEADGKPGLQHEFITGLVKEIRDVEDKVKFARPKADAAITYCYDSRWAIEFDTDCEFYPDRYELLDTMMPIYEAMQRLGLTVEIVPPTADLSGYKLVASPMQYLVTDEIVSNFRRYVDNGGTLVGTFRSGVKDWHDVMLMQTLPGPLSDIYGIELLDWDYLKEEEVAVRFADGSISRYVQSGRCFAEMLKLNDAEPLASYDSLFGGAPAASIRNIAKGGAVYVGSRMDADFYQPLFRRLMEDAGWSPKVNAPEGVEIIPQEDGTLFLLNYSDEAKEVELEGRYQDVITGTEADGKANVPARSVMALVDM